MGQQPGEGGDARRGSPGEHQGSGLRPLVGATRGLRPVLHAIVILQDVVVRSVVLLHGLPLTRPRWSRGVTDPGRPVVLFGR